jgi:IS30 family transposase
MNMPQGRSITYYEREKIEVWLRNNRKKTFIANQLNRDYSVIKREIKRNTSKLYGYTAKRAQYLANQRARKTNTRKLDKLENKELKEYIISKLKDGWSPDEIAGRLKEQPPKEVYHCKDKVISHESIYDWIYNGDKQWLYKYLRRKQPKRKRRFSRKKRQFKGILKNRVSIHKRPIEIESKEEVGHWETDSVIFKGKSILSVQYERATSLVKVHKCEDKSSVRSEEALRDSMSSLPEEFCLSITRDNGSENALHHKTKIQSYFCDPYCSWQKGGVENINGLIREYLPKGINLDTVTDLEIQEIEDKLNNRPRKKLNYLTPNEVITIELEKRGFHS